MDIHSTRTKGHIIYDKSRMDVRFKYVLTRFFGYRPISIDAPKYFKSHKSQALSWPLPLIVLLTDATCQTGTCPNFSPSPPQSLNLPRPLHALRRQYARRGTFLLERNKEHGWRSEKPFPHKASGC